METFNICELEELLHKADAIQDKVKREFTYQEEMKNYHGSDEVISFKDALELTKEEYSGFAVKTGITGLDKALVEVRENDLILITGDPKAGKCFGKGTEILLKNGDVKNIEEIVVGDVLMGDDGTIRNVLSLARGKDEMFRVSYLGEEEVLYVIKSIS